MRRRPCAPLAWKFGLALVAVLVVGITACAPSAASVSGGQASPAAPAKPKILNIGVTTELTTMGAFSGGSTGGWTTLNEMHSAGLITSDVSTPRQIGRLAEKVPSVDDGSILIQPDGKMRVMYTLRRNVSWQDGMPFTAQDLIFSHAFLVDKGLPVAGSDTARKIEKIEAVDDHTAAFVFSKPYFLANSLGPREFWPQPRHLLGEAFDRYKANGNADEVVNLPYWTSAYVNLGPFRLTAFDPGEGATFQAYDGYFLGKPKIDTIYVKPFRDENTLFANLLAGSVDLFPDPALHAELASQLEEQWTRSGAGNVYELRGTTSFLSVQWRPGVQSEPANLDPRVRGALYQAIDRDGFPPELVKPAYSILPPGDRFFEAVKDGMRRYPFDPGRAKAVLQDLGWTPGPDGMLRNNADGRRFQNKISTTATGRLWEVATYADSWRRIGVEVEEAQVPASRARDLEYRASFPSWEATSAGQGDAILNRLAGPAASAANRWSGNRGGYEEPETQLLLERYYSSVSQPDQFNAMRAIGERVANELPFLISYNSIEHTGVRKGVKALDDLAGGQHSSRPYGTYSRNAHLWDLE